jgi:hypothetical protein
MQMLPTSMPSPNRPLFFPTLPAILDSLTETILEPTVNYSHHALNLKLKSYVQYLMDYNLVQGSIVVIAALGVHPLLPLRRLHANASPRTVGSTTRKRQFSSRTVHADLSSIVAATCLSKQDFPKARSELVLHQIRLS